MMLPTAMLHAESTSILYAEHRQGLFTMALSVVRDPGLAEDAVHDGVHRVLARGRPPEGDPVAFLYAAVRNAAIDLTRRRRVRRAAAIEGSLFDAREPDPRIRAMDREAAARLRAAIDGLTPEQQEVVVLRAVARLGFEQIAAVVDAPLGTVAARYHRAIAALRTQFEGSNA
jgi:RNA polymerase sigma-70 factor (ECF subfamily)